MNRLAALPLACLVLTAATFIAAPILIGSIETKLNALEERVEARNELVKSIQ